MEIRNKLLASNQESGKLGRSALVTGSMTFVSRISGLARDILFAQLFGASSNMDSFLVSFKIPNLLRRFFAEGAFSQGFVPVINEYKEKKPEQVDELVANTLGVLFVSLFFITLIGVIFAPILIYLFAPGFSGDPDQMNLTIEMLRYCFPYILFISLTSLLGSVLNTYGIFSVPSITPVILNLTFIAFAVFFSTYFNPPELSLAIAVFFAGIFQLLFQFPFIVKLKFSLRPKFNHRYEGVKKIFNLMLPGIFGSSVAQINIMVDTLLASFLVSGSISWLYFSDRLMEFPLGVFGVAIATVILPRLSSNSATKDFNAFLESLFWAINAVVTIALPAMIGLIIIGEPLIYLIFGSDEFSLFDVNMAYFSLICYSLGLIGFMLIKVLAASFFAVQDTKTPVRFAVIAMCINVIFNLLFIVLFSFLSINALHAALALATSLAAIINCLLLTQQLKKRHDFHGRMIFNSRNSKKMLIASLMGLTLWQLRPFLLEDFASMTKIDVGLSLSVLIILGSLTYLLLWFIFVRKFNLKDLL
ncbi:MAG: murein biosynthesis integral membrane protein MurJ [Proteobacteria bacterium]|nr:murein biosynthesis integral membrane protein MurJ [Pseudomonadota bacterium]